MSFSPSRAVDNTAAFDLKGRMLTLSVLRLLSVSPAKVAAQLDAKIAQAPELFRGLPVLLDMEPVAAMEFDLPALLSVLRERGLEVAGVRAGFADAAARAVGLAVIPVSPAEAPRRIREVSRERPATSLVVRQPIRSGQQVYARGGDLIVLAAVSAGAEILADGNIHVYGSLRGRALAGVQGNREARIFCRSLEAELISIAGNYQISEQFRDEARSQPVQIYLRDESLCIEPL